MPANGRWDLIQCLMVNVKTCMVFREWGRTESVVVGPSYCTYCPTDRPTDHCTNQLTIHSTFQPTNKLHGAQFLSIF